MAQAINRPSPGVPTSIQQLSALSGVLAFPFAFIAVIGGIIFRRWLQMGTYVTGGDPGNWFAFGRQLFGGTGKSTPGAYPPLVPFLLHVGQWLVAPMTVARLVAAGSLAAVMIAMYVAASQGMNRWLALAVAAVIGLSDSVMEAVAWGGYPQNYSLAFLLIAGVALASYLRTRSRRWLVVGALMLAGAALSHHMYYGVACLIVGLIWVVWLTTRPSRRQIVRGTLSLVIASLPSVVCFLPTYIALLRAGYSAPLGASGVDTSIALRYSIIEATWLWIPLISSGVAYLAFTLPSRRRPVWALAMALLLTSGGLFAVSGESRLIPLLISGAALACGLALQELHQRYAYTLLAAMPLTAAAVFLILLFPRADAHAADLYQYYRMVDHSLIDTAAWINAHTDRNSLVVIHEDERGWALGWWFEGLTRARIVVQSEPQWLSIPKERQNAVLAQGFFDPTLSTDGARILARQTGVRYLVFREWEWLGWRTWTAAQPIKAVYDDGEFMILDLGAG